jgi:hypothetical protein
MMTDHVQADAFSGSSWISNHHPAVFILMKPTNPTFSRLIIVISTSINTTMNVNSA